VQVIAPGSSMTAQATNHRMCCCVQVHLLDDLLTPNFVWKVCCRHRPHQPHHSAVATGQAARHSQHSSSSSNRPCHAFGQSQAPQRTSTWHDCLQHTAHTTRTMQAARSVFSPVSLLPCWHAGLHLDAEQAYCWHQGLLQLCTADAGSLPRLGVRSATGGSSQAATAAALQFHTTWHSHARSAASFETPQSAIFTNRVHRVTLLFHWDGHIRGV
jgi:hypothetical protein